jgi:hypothetical protein
MGAAPRVGQRHALATPRSAQRARATCPRNPRPASRQQQRQEIIIRIYIPCGLGRSWSSTRAHRGCKRCLTQILQARGSSRSRRRGGGRASNAGCGPSWDLRGRPVRVPCRGGGAAAAAAAAAAAEGSSGRRRAASNFPARRVACDGHRTNRLLGGREARRVACTTNTIGSRGFGSRQYQPPSVWCGVYLVRALPPAAPPPQHGIAVARHLRQTASICLRLTWSKALVLGLMGALTIPHACH